MNSDFRELLHEFAKYDVRYLVVGGYAVVHYSQPRFTKDLDLWIEPSTENARAVAKAFLAFGIPLVEVTEDDFATEGTQFMIGRPPVMFDFLTSLPGLDFSEAWENREIVDDDDLPVCYLGCGDLIKAKKIAGRRVDLADLEEIERSGHEFPGDS